MTTLDAQSSIHEATPKTPLALRGRDRFDEEKLIRHFLKSLNLTPEHRVLDVGCGYGRKLDWLREDGYDATGVDINEHHVTSVRNRGFKAHTAAEFATTEGMYDAILMAHIVEHFAPDALLAFVDSYLDRLRIGGHLLISTPLEWNNFYADFDHTKPYHPNAFTAVFCNPDSQVQYHSRHRMELVALGLRRIPIQHPRLETLYASMNDVDSLWRVTRRLSSKISRVLFRASGGVLGGQTNGWVGMFQKLGER